MAPKKKPNQEFGLQRHHLLAGIAVTLFLLCLVFYPLPLMLAVVSFSFTGFFARGTALKPLPSTKPQAKGTANRKASSTSPYLPFF